MPVEPEDTLDDIQQLTFVRLLATIRGLGWPTHGALVKIAEEMQLRPTQVEAIFDEAVDIVNTRLEIDA